MSRRYSGCAHYARSSQATHKMMMLKDVQTQVAKYVRSLARSGLLAILLTLRVDCAARRVHLQEVLLDSGLLSKFRCVNLSPDRTRGRFAQSSSRSFACDQGLACSAS
jgi:hypothetical protein